MSRRPPEGMERLCVTPPELAALMGVPVPALDGLESAGVLPPRIIAAAGRRRIELYYLDAVRKKLAASSGEPQPDGAGNDWLNRLPKPRHET